MVPPNIYAWSLARGEFSGAPPRRDRFFGRLGRREYPCSMGRAASAVALGAVIACGAGCSSAPEPIAFQNRVFYQYDELAGELSPFERRYPQLDRAEEPPNPQYIGVCVLEGAVCFPRPRNWIVRRASLSPEKRFIEYVSPAEYIFAIYERIDSPTDPWREVLQRYEDDQSALGAKIIGGRVPIATANAQGRAYVLRRSVRGAKAPFENVSHEFLARSEMRIALVQIVHQTPNIEPVTGELLPVVNRLELY